jgi:hypothetical protein
MENIPQSARWAWLAGFLDGEGCFQITREKRSSGYAVYAARVSATNTVYELLTQCRTIAGGTVRDATKGTATWKRSYRWAIVGPTVTDSLQMLLPYLVAKRPHAELLLLFRSTIRLGAEPGVWGKRTLAEIDQRREQMKLAMNALNHRGSVSIPPHQQAALDAVLPLLEKQRQLLGALG